MTKNIIHYIFLLPKDNMRDDSFPNFSPRVRRMCPTLGLLDEISSILALNLYFQSDMQGE